MKTRTVEELMIPLAEYTTVSQEATLRDAIKALEEAQQKYDNTRAKHRAILVYNENNYIVGKISQLDILKALEPKYDTIDDLKSVSRFGLSPKFMKSMLKKFDLWETPLYQLGKMASKLKVKDFMYTPTEGEFVNKKASLNEAIHQLVLGQHQSLLVIYYKDIVGILRLIDVFKEICNAIEGRQTDV